MCKYVLLIIYKKIHSNFAFKFCIQFINLVKNFFRKKKKKKKKKKIKKIFPHPGISKCGKNILI